MYQPKVWVIQMEVTDTGPGIEPAMQDKVFEPFVQGDQTLSRSYGGTGLGLSICRQLATMMKGTLTLKSTIGKGSTFTLTLPYHKPVRLWFHLKICPVSVRMNSESFQHPHTSLSDSPNVDSDSSDNKHEGGNAGAPPKLKRRETSSSSSASSSEANKHKLDLDKPLLYTRGSTVLPTPKPNPFDPHPATRRKEARTITRFLMICHI
ncbi:hypothetical protein Cantr_03602 [Candida viswanathii]|uniref:histidine kinase n=1 Tax=Candida viswanathii TaxID=5486 RepID=A0A367YL30_9ASCO|nr:hypothetical protein Cantr_03578 [Candida viswanathii]RCK66576.1 hypothetical protein Cantr_03592 [Candida viswanathii]RCK66585.1 hypothetical protein Cantr_03602 [Candida viswanathii]